MDQMPAYIQEVLDLIEYANGPVTSKWGAQRAAAGHPGPFGLQYLGIGNEDAITPGFRERFEMIYKAVKAKHPEIVVIGTVGPNPDGHDYVNGWKIADELRLPMVDEHCYKSPQWLWENLLRYDAYDRSKSKVYLGEWAAFDDKRRSTLRSAIAEAAYLTALERNGDVVSFASYAPLLAKRDHTHWSPNLIYFSNTEVFPTINYHVQQLFSVNNGDTYLPTTVKDPAPADFAASTVKHSAQGTVILKLVNGANAARPVRIELSGAKRVPSTAEFTVLAGPDANAANDYASPRTVLPQTKRLPISGAFDYEAPAHSLTVIRIVP
jgi:alpha-L-arabinofuranosidase